MVSLEPMSPEVADHIRLIKSSGIHIDSIVDDVLDFKRITSAKFVLEAVEFDFLELISELQKVYAIVAKKTNTTWTVKISESVPRFILGDSKRIRQCIVNLLSNAFKFVQRKGDHQLSSNTAAAAAAGGAGGIDDVPFKGKVELSIDIESFQPDDVQSAAAKAAKPSMKYGRDASSPLPNSVPAGPHTAGGHEEKEVSTCVSLHGGVKGILVPGGQRRYDDDLLNDMSSDADSRTLAHVDAATLAATQKKGARQTLLSSAASMRHSDCDGAGAAVSLPRMLHVKVRDNGIGIAPEVLPLLGQAFQQANSSIGRRFGGSGLGLSIVKGLISHMNGYVTIDSRQHEFSEFGLHFELKDLPNVPPPQSPRHNPSIQLHRTTNSAQHDNNGTLNGGQRLNSNTSAMHRGKQSRREVDQVSVHVSSIVDRLTGSEASRSARGGSGDTDSRRSMSKNAEQLTASPSPSPSPTKRKLGPLKVLLAEDVKINQKLFTFFMKQSHRIIHRSVELTIANDGQEAVDIVQGKRADGELTTRKPSFDIM